MSSILVFGASGAVGRFLLPRLAPLYTVRPVSRQSRGGDWVVGELNDPAWRWPETDIGISLGPLDAFAAAFGRARPAGLRRVIALSSMSAESKAASPDAEERALAARLVESEQRLLHAAACAGVAVTVFRPTLIYGAGTDASLAPIARFAQRWHVLPIPLGAHGLRQPVHADDLAAACVAALDVAATNGRVYPLGGGERLSAEQMFRRIATAVPGWVLPIPMPVTLLQRVSARRAAVLRLRQDLVAENASAQADFGYAPRAFDACAVLPAPIKSI